MLFKIKQIIGGESALRTEIAHGAIGSLAVNLLGKILGLFLAVVLARNLGPDGYGVYAYVFSLMSLVSIPAQLGLPNLLIRETARAHVNAQWGLMRGIWRWATLAVGIISILLAVVALILGQLFSERFSSTQLTTFAVGIMSVPLASLGNLRGAAMSGLRRVVLGRMPEFILRPGILILLILSAAHYLSPARLSAAHAMGLYVAAAALSFVFGAVLLWRVRPNELKTAPEPEYATRAWLTAALPLALINGIQLINHNTDIIMLGLFRSPEHVGVYKVVVTGATLVAFGLQTINSVISPYFARLHAQGDTKRLQRLVTLSARTILFISLPVVLLFVFFGDVVLAHVFGKEYISGHIPLAILAVGQLVNAAMGSVGALLTMTGHERDTARGLATGAIANVILNFILIPFFGINGAAVATALTLMAWNLVMWRAVHQRLGIESMAFKIFPIRSKK